MRKASTVYTLCLVYILPTAYSMMLLVAAIRFSSLVSWVGVSRWCESSGKFLILRGKCKMSLCCDDAWGAAQTIYDMFVYDDLWNKWMRKTKAKKNERDWNPILMIRQTIYRETYAFYRSYTLSYLGRNRIRVCYTRAIMLLDSFSIYVNAVSVCMSVLIINVDQC